MSLFEAIILGIIQGITEFFPVSSSGHLILFQKLLGLNNLNHYVFFDLICHLGTLLAVVLIFFKEVKLAFSEKRYFFQIILGTLPLFPLVLLLHPLKALFNKVELLGYFFLLTAIILYIGEHFKRKSTVSNRSYKEALGIGCFQALAILPGVSRSGSTIAGAKLFGWKTEQAIAFSFLLSIPAILGGMILETKEIFFGSSNALVNFEPLTYLAGFATAFFTGFIALKCLIRIAIRDKFKIFIWYCAGIGFLTLYLFH